jgi:hypothetical protein
MVAAPAAVGDPNRPCAVDEPAGMKWAPSSMVASLLSRRLALRMWSGLRD